MVYEVPHAQLNALSKQIPDDESDLSLDVLRDHVPELERYAEANPKAFAHAARLQKSNSKITEHARGGRLPAPARRVRPGHEEVGQGRLPGHGLRRRAGEETISKLGLLKIDLLVVVALARQAYAEQLIGRVHDVTSTSTRCPRSRTPRPPIPRP
jgi:hypothetical protein